MPLQIEPLVDTRPVPNNLFFKTFTQNYVKKKHLHKIMKDDKHIR